MSYQSTMTRKGQITIPKEIRKDWGLEGGEKLDIDYEKEKKKATIKPAPDILDLAGTFKPKKKINVLKARKWMEKHYERV